MSYISGGTLKGVLRQTAPTTTPSTAPAGEGRMYFDGSVFQLSQNGGAYGAVATTSSVGWTDDGTVVRLNTVTDGVGIGIAGIAASSKLEVLGDATRTSVSITGGDPGGASTGGTISMIAGAGGATGVGGAVTVRSGAGGATSGNSGDVTIHSGAVTSGAVGVVNLGVGGASQWRVATTGHFVAVTDNTNDIGASGATRPRTAYIGTSVVVGATVTIATSSVTGSGALTVAATGAVLSLDGTALESSATTFTSDAGFGVVATGALALGAAAATTAVNVATDANAKTVTVGNVTGASAVVLNSGTGGLDLNATGAGGVTIDAGATGGISIDAGAASNFSTTTGDLTVQAGTNASLLLNGAGASGVVALQTGGTTRWLVDGSGHLLTNAAADNTYDIGATGASRPRRVYVGTEVVVGSTITISTNTIAGSANVTIDTGAAGTLNLGNTNATSIVLGSASTAVSIPNDLVITGDLTVNGTVTTINTANLTVTDALIYANNGGVADSPCGMAWDQGAEEDAIVLFNGVAGRFELGRADTTGGTAVPANLTTFSDLKVNNLLLDNTAVTADGALTVTATAAALTLAATSTNVVNVQTDGATRWQVTSAGHLLPGATDNAEDIGGAGTNRIRTLYAGTSVVVGSTITIGSSTIASSTTLALTSAAGTGGAAGSALSATAGNGDGAGAGGAVTLTSGDGGATGAGGAVSLTGGAGGATSGAGGAVTVSGGAAVTGAGGLLTLQGGIASTSGAGGGVTILGRNGVGGASAGGAVNLTSGNSIGATEGGDLGITAGNGGATGSGGDVTVSGGVGGSTSGNGGVINVLAGACTSGEGGGVFLVGGASAAGAGGVAQLQAGDGTTVGGEARMYSGNATSGANAGGVILIECGQGAAAGGAGGEVQIHGGLGGATSGAGGAVSIRGGIPTDGNGGSVSLTGNAGVGTNRDGGSVTLQSGVATGSGTAGTILFNTNGANERARITSAGRLGVGTVSPVATLDTDGSVSAGDITTVSGNTTLDDTHSVVLVDASGGAITITLPAVSGISRRRYTIKKIDSSINAVTIDGNAAETIDGVTTQSLIVQYDSLEIVTNGTEWFIL